MNAVTISLTTPFQVPGRSATGFAAAAILLFGSPLSAQTSDPGPLSESWTISVVGGILSYEPSDDESFPIFSVRADHSMSEYIRLEIETSYSRPDVQQDEGFVFDPSLPTKSANLFTLTAGFQARHTMGRVEPYGGISAGLFARVDDDSEGRRFSRNTFSFPFGLRIWITDHLGIRGEYRFREDNHEVVTYSNNETTVGLFWTF